MYSVCKYFDRDNFRCKISPTSTCVCEYFKRIPEYFTNTGHYISVGYGSVDVNNLVASTSTGTFTARPLTRDEFATVEDILRNEHLEFLIPLFNNGDII